MLPMSANQMAQTSGYMLGEETHKNEHERLEFMARWERSGSTGRYVYVHRINGSGNDSGVRSAATAAKRVVERRRQAGRKQASANGSAMAIGGSRQCKQANRHEMCEQVCAGRMGQQWRQIVGAVGGEGMRCGSVCA